MLEESANKLQSQQPNPNAKQQLWPYSYLHFHQKLTRTNNHPNNYPTIFRKMKSIFRIYAKTSKGNDNYLLKQLKALNLKPKYDQHLNAFYFNSNWHTLFDVSFKSLTVEQMYIQIGQKFKIVDQQQITTELQRLPFKNYLPIQRGLVQNTTLKILIRQSAHIPSDNVLISLFTNNLNKEIVKKEYFKEIDSAVGYEKIFHHDQTGEKGLLQVRRQRKNDTSYFEIKETVERKWFQEDEKRSEQRANRILQLEQQHNAVEQRRKKLLIEHNRLKVFEKNQSQKTQNISTKLTIPLQIQQTQTQLTNLKEQIKALESFSEQTFFSQQLSYYPHLVFYIRKNSGRFLLKINKESLYKHGWKSQVNWGPIRESIAASILHQSSVLQKKEHKCESNPIIKIWDPMCGSGTFGLVAATMLEQIPVRSDVEKLFDWVYWPVYKKQYIQEYQNQKEEQKKSNPLNYQLILSDKDRQSINYSINNFRLMLQTHKVQLEDKQTQSSELFPSKMPLSQTLEILTGKIGFACGDFQQVMEILKTPKGSAQKSIPLNIMTNLPYVHSRSQEKYPLNQLTSIYSRFSQMIKQNSQFIDNVFIILDKNILSKHHFLNISDQKWNLIGEYESGGMEIGLYAWENNKIKAKFEQGQFIEENAVVYYQKIKGEITSEDRQLILNKEKNVERALIEYRKKLSQIDRKYYKLPSHLYKKDLKGWKRVMQKRRKRHLLSAYELFARRRDKMIALKQYAHQKLQIRMMRRGTVWKNKNLRFFDHSESKLSEYSEEIKQAFEKKIEDALKREEDYQQKKKIKSGNKIFIAKKNNKWNADQKKMIRQIKNSQESQVKNRKGAGLRAKSVGKRR